ncbi:MAG TPA: hypothetical protein VGM88_33140 [Kofleriaceae bacterium]|jgi:hypothetical protein
MVAETTVLASLREQPPELPPLVFETTGSPLDLVATWEGVAVRFHGDVSARATPQLLAVAAHRAKSRAFDSKGESHPLLIVPYLSPSNLAEVEKLGLSAIDLCGNGVVHVPGRWHIVRSGQPNRFRGAAASSRGVYGGTTSLVARAFLMQPSFDRISDLHGFLRDQGSSITLATVSKAVAGLESDLVVAREGKGIELIQPQTLLDKLRDAYRPPQVSSRQTFKTSGSVSQIVRNVEQLGFADQTHIVPTGITSAIYRGALVGDPVVSFYCSEPAEELMALLGLLAVGGRGPAGIELLFTRDERAYVAQRAIDGVRLSSSVQTWLELATSDKRGQEVADRLREKLIKTGEVD